jgi:hypothetical protein
MKKILILLVIATFPILGWGQNTKIKDLNNSGSGGNPVLSDVDASDTTRWGAGGNTVLTGVDASDTTRWGAGGNTVLTGVDASDTTRWGSKVDTTYLSTSLSNVKAGIFNILDFGAVSNDGTGSDNEAIQAAIDSAYTFVQATLGTSIPIVYGATVYIPAGKWYIDAPDTLRAFVSIKAEHGAVFLFPSDYTECMWTNTRSSFMREVYVEGGFYRFPTIHTTADFMRIHSDKNANYASFNTVKDIKIEHARYCFLMSADWDPDEGWANCFTIENIFTGMCKTFIKAVDMDGNNISNIQFNAATAITDTVFNIQSDWNIISHVLIHDPTAQTVGYYIEEGAIQNDISASTLPYLGGEGYWDEGTSTIIKAAGSIYANNFSPTLKADSTLVSGSGAVTFFKSKDAVTTAGTYVRMNDYLGQLNFMGLTAAGYEKGAQILSTVYGYDPGTGDMPGSLQFNTSSDGSASPALRFLVGNISNRSYLPFNPSTDGAVSLGESGVEWSNLFINTGGAINWEASDVTLTHSANTLTLGGGNLALGANNLTMTGSLGATGAGKLTKIWAIDGEFSNVPTIGGVAAVDGVALADSGSTPEANHYASSTMLSKKLNLADSASTPEAGHYATSKMLSLKPTITTAAADTTGITPSKAGDIFIDTNASKVYISKSALRGGWLILNSLWFLLFIKIKWE